MMKNNNFTTHLIVSIVLLCLTNGINSEFEIFRFGWGMRVPGRQTFLNFCVAISI